MSDALESVLKDAIKKIIAEAIAESTAAGLKPAFATASAAPPMPMPVRVRPAIPNPVRAAGTGWERAAFAFKSLCLGAFALGACGLASSILFPSNFARAANDWAWLQDVHRQAIAAEHRRDPNLTSLNEPDDPAVAACMAQNQQNVPQKLTWTDLASPSKLISMYKNDVFLHADADDLTAIVLFYELTRMAKGQPVTLKDLPADFKNSLPCKWLPAFNAITSEFPEPQPLPPVPVNFIGPFAQYFD